MRNLHKDLGAVGCAAALPVFGSSYAGSSNSDRFSAPNGSQEVFAGSTTPPSTATDGRTGAICWPGMSSAREVSADARALFALGVRCAGVNADVIGAHKWFNLAARCGHRDAAARRAEIAGQMSVEEVAVAQRAARNWLQTH
jgi:uncharacterized protein